jgi:hypothetical protein
VRTVHVVAKTHLDLGFTALAAEVEARYLGELFPRAIAAAEALAGRGGAERLVWTTGSWVLHRALDDPDRDRAERVAEGVRQGHLAWHALPLTFHTELMDAPLVRSALGIAAELDDRFGRRTVAAKMTDVPGHARALVPLLAEAGVRFLHLGVNPAWPVPDVPPAFRWRSPDGAEVVVAYQAGGYGGVVEVAGCPDVLAFLHGGDNAGPPSVDEVVAAHDDLRRQFPGAEVRASTLDAFARVLEASGSVAELPVVTAEIGDPWLFGAGSDPQKVAGHRSLLRARTSAAPDLAPAEQLAIDRQLLLVAEHTWGLDQKEVLPTEPGWDAGSLRELRASAAGRRFEASWAEQRAYVAAADDLLTRFGRSLPQSERDRPNPVVEGLRPVALEGDGAGHLGVDAGPLAGLNVDPVTGALVGWRTTSGRVLASPEHPLGLITHQTFDEADYDRFYAGLQPVEADAWWARRDNTKPGIDAAGARSCRRSADEVAAWTSVAPGAEGTELLVRLTFVDPTEAGQGPWEVWLRWRAAVVADGGSSVRPDEADDAGLELEVWWAAKAATRLPEATWCSFVPQVAEPDRWMLDKLGQAVSPLDVVRRGGRSLHAVGEGMAYDGPDGALRIRTLDAPLVAPGAPNLLDADPPVPDLAGGFHVLLHDNCWGTNFPMWSEGPARFRFALTAGGRTAPG